MSSSYFVAIRPQSNEHHTIHKEGCPFMPDDRKRIFLGNFHSTFDALSAGKKHFSETDNCRFCSQEHHHEVHSPAVTLNLISAERMTAGWENAFQCCLN